MRQPRINTSQVQYILSHKIFFEEFTPNKSYNKSIIIRHGDSLYLSKYEIAEKPTFDPNDWIKFSNAADLESLIQEEKERAIAVEISLRNDLDAEIIRASQAESDLDEAKLNKIIEANKIYATNNNNEQISIGYSSSNNANTIAQRDANSQLNVALTPSDNSNATSKKYVDDRIDAAISEAVVFKGIVENETELPSSGNTNGDMYWIRAFSDNPPQGMTPGRSGAAIYNGELEEFQFTEDAIYQPDNNTIKLNANGQLAVMVSVENNNSIEIKNDGIFVDISEKLDKVHSASKVYVTDSNSAQSSISYDTSNTANTIAQRDNNSQLNVALTPTANSNATSKKYVDDADSLLNTNKQDRPSSAVANNIATFNNNKDTIDSGKSFITSINDSLTASNNKIPTELAVRTELDTKVDKTENASKVYITDNSGNQSTISYSTLDTASTIVERDANSQINVAQTPTANSNATSKKYVDDAILGLETNKQNRPDSATQNNIAVFNDTLDTIDSGKSFTTTISSEAVDTKIPTEKAVRTGLNAKVDKTNTSNQVYVTDNSGNQTIITYTDTDTASTIVKRDTNKQINVALTPTANSNATSKKYVDDADLSLNTNKQNRPSTATQNNIAVFNNSKDTIDSGKSFTTTISSEAVDTKIPTEKAVRTELDTKVDKTDTANQVYITSNIGEQSTITYDSANTANTIASRDNNGQINVSLTPTANTNAASKKYVDDADSSLNTNKQNRPSSATQNNIAIFNNSKDTIDSGKSFTTTINDSSTASDTKIATELAVRTELDTKVDANTAIIGATKTKITYDSKGLVTSGTDLVESDIPNLHLSKISDVTASANEVNVLDGIVVTTNELNQLHEGNAVKDDFIKLHSITATSNEINVLDGITASTAELNYVDGVTSNIQTQLDNKRDKVTSASKVYVTDSNSTQSSISYTTANTASTIVQRDSNSQINVAQTPTDNTHATSKKYVDDKIDSVISEAVVFKGIVANETLLPASGNNNGDMYWITAYSDNPPAGMTPGVSGSAIYKKPEGQVGEWNYTQDSIYQPDNNSIELDANGQLSVMVSETANNSLVKNNDGLYVDISGKLDANTAITGATKTKITYDSKGLVTAGADLIESDIPNIHLSKISDVTASVSEINVLDGITASTTELNYVDGVTSPIQTQLDNKITKNTAITGATKTKITYDSKGLVTSGADLEASDIPNITLSKISDITASASEINVLDGITASTNELNVLDGITASTTELNYVDGVTSNIQTQLDNKAVDSDVVHITDAETITGAKTFENTDSTGVNLTALTLKGDNLHKGTNPSTNHFNSIDFTDDSNVNIAKFSAIQTSDGWTGFLAGAGSDPTNPQNNLLMIANGNSKLLLIPSTSSHASCAVRRDFFNDNAVKHTPSTAVGSSSQPIYVASDGTATACSLTAGDVGAVEANAAITGATKTKISYDSKGLVTAGADLEASDIPNLTLSKISDVTASAVEVNVLDGITATTTELNYVDGVTSNIQTQLNSKQATLVSGTNIKTINNNSILGSGNLDIDGLPSQSGQSGKYLTTNGTTASWATVSQTLSGLTDTNISSATNGQVLTYDNSSSKWVNQTYYAMVIEDFTAS